MAVTTVETRSGSALLPGRSAAVQSDPGAIRRSTLASGARVALHL